jgi:hypothetical protein
MDESKMTLEEYIESVLHGAKMRHESNKRLAPNSYGTGVEWGAIDTCEAILSFLKDNPTPNL